MDCLIYSVLWPCIVEMEELFMTKIREEMIDSNFNYLIISKMSSLIYK